MADHRGRPKRQGTMRTPSTIPTSDKLVVKEPTTWTPRPVPASAMPFVSPTDPTPTWDPALTGYGRPAEFDAWPQNFSEDYVKKSLATRQDFREDPSYPGDWQTGLFDCCAPPGGCETCLMGERAHAAPHAPRQCTRAKKGEEAYPALYAVCAFTNASPREGRLGLPVDADRPKHGPLAAGPLLREWLLLV